jgi:hypothetical protein
MSFSSASLAANTEPKTGSLLYCVRNFIDREFLSSDIYVPVQSLDFSAMPSSMNPLPAQYSVTFQAFEKGGYVANYYGSVSITVDKLQNLKNPTCTWLEDSANPVGAEVKMSNLRKE